MQTSKLRPLFTLEPLRKEFTRTVAATNAAVKTETTEALKSWKEIPGPTSLPIIGQIHHFLPGGELENFLDPNGLNRAVERYGPIFKFDGVLGKPTMLFLTDPESSATILRNENVLPLRPGFYSLEHYRKENRKARGYTIEATGLMTDHGDVWKEFRSTVNPIMLQPKTIKLYCNVLDEVALDMIARLKADRNEKNMIQRPFDMEMNLWSLESIGTVALGCRLNCLDPNLPEDGPEMQLIKCIHELFGIIIDLDYKPSIWRYFSTPLYRKAMKMYENHEKLTKHFVQKGREQLNNNAKKSDNEKGVLEKLLAINEDVALIMASDMLFAGVDTSSNVVSATLYLLAKNPEQQKKLREEILSKSEKKPYLKACIKESLRIMPVVTGNLRVTTKEYNILGYRIPENMHIIFNNKIMSIMDKYYPRANEFLPERWICDKTDPLYYGNAHPFTIAPFGFGVRSCIGRRIAELEIETILTRMIENFEVEWIGDPPVVIPLSVNYLKGPFNFIFNDVKKDT